MLKKILLTGEIEDISMAIEKLNGYRTSTVEEIKKNRYWYRDAINVLFVYKEKYNAKPLLQQNSRGKSYNKSFSWKGIWKHSKVLKKEIKNSNIKHY